MDAPALKSCATCGLAKPVAEHFYWRKRDKCYDRDCKACCTARKKRSAQIQAAAAKGVVTRRPDPLPAQPIPDRAPDTRMHRLQLQLDKHWDKLCAKAIEAALAGDRQMLKYLMEVAANASSNTGKLGLVLGELY